ncbi:TWiK family of potassium channels protein 18-like [Rhopilema esculentum]|uniref:TWiK family of potassium channels protein 18-like n=1 Tax=Rhopilema esculentum TaxID=499914 RepID=UPI0031D05ABF|eukprot:gene10622-19362_t
MPFENGKKALLSLVVYTTMCFAAAGILMIIEYEGTNEYTQYPKQDAVLQVAGIMNDTLGIGVNASTALTMIKQVTAIIEQRRMFQTNAWKREMSTRTFLKWRYFVGVTLSTVGYGDIYPTTSWGKAFVVAFSLIGIPVCMFTLATMGSLFCEIFVKFKAWIKSKIYSQRNIQRGPTVYCVIQCGAFTLLFVITCGMGIATLEDWKYSDGIYWAFITFTTIGFGDFTPKSASKWYSECLNLLAIFGLAFVAMTFDIALRVANENIAKQSSAHSKRKHDANELKSKQPPFENRVQTEI